jgi:hypothetical protein
VHAHINNERRERVMTTREEWIEIHKQERVEAGMPLAEQAMIGALAGVVLVDRLKRAVITGTTSKGRIITKLTGEETEAEKKWKEIQARHAPAPRIVKGGPLIGQEF